MGDESTSIDIELFFQQRLSSDVSAFRGRGLRADIIQQLVTLSGGLFIWASTTIRFVECGFPAERLKTIINASRPGLSHARLDDLYRIALTHSFNTYSENELETVNSILGAITVAREPLTSEQLSRLLNLTVIIVHNVLLQLQPLLSSHQGRLVRFLHASFPDFLRDLKRCRDPKWHIITSTHHLDLASHCLRVMEQDLKFNICGIETSYYRNKDIKDIQERIDRTITPVLMYACQFH